MKCTSLLSVGVYVFCLLLLFSPILVKANPANTLTITNVSTGLVTDHPVQIARPFMKGEIANFPQVVFDGTPLLTQVDVKQRWNDGSVKHAIISFIAPSLPNNTPVTVSFRNQSTGNNTPLPQQEMLSNSFNFDATMDLTFDNGVQDTASAREMLQNGDYTLWTEGPIATTLILADHSAARVYDMGSDQYRSVRPIYHATFWPTLNKVRVRYIGEIANTEAMQRQKFALRLGLGTNDTTVYTKRLSTYEYATRWTRSFWIGGEPEVAINIDHNLSYLKETRFFFNYDTTLRVPETTIANSYNSFLSSDTDIHGKGIWTTYMPQTGGSPEYGPHPDWVSRWLYSGDWRMYNMSAKLADLTGNWSLYLREGDPTKVYDRKNQVSALGKPISVNARPTLRLFSDRNSKERAEDTIFYAGYTTKDNALWSRESRSPNWVVDNAHRPNPFSALYTLTGDYWYLEQQKFWVAHSIMDVAAGYRGPGNSAALVGQVRAQGRVFRDRLNAALLAPDNSPEKEYFNDTVYDAIAAWAGYRNVPLPGLEDHPTYVWAKAKNITYSPNHFWEDNRWRNSVTTYDDGGDGFTTEPYAAVSMWMNSIMLTYLGMGADLGYPLTTLQEWLTKSHIIPFEDPTVSPHILGAYGVASRDADGNFYTWEQIKWIMGDAYYNTVSTGEKIAAGTASINPATGYQSYPYLASALYANLSPEAKTVHEWLRASYYDTQRSAFAKEPKRAVLPRVNTPQMEQTLVPNYPDPYTPPSTVTPTPQPSPISSPALSEVCPYTWTRNLEDGARGSDVRALQRFLNAVLPTSLTTSGEGSPGQETDYYGSLTGAGVARFQEMYASEILVPLNLSAGTPFFYDSTRAKANELCGVSGEQTSQEPQAEGASESEYDLSFVPYGGKDGSLWSWAYVDERAKNYELVKASSRGMHLSVLRDLSGNERHYYNNNGLYPGYDRGLNLTADWGTYQTDLTPIARHSFNDNGAIYGQYMDQLDTLRTDGEFYLTFAGMNTRTNGHRDLWGRTTTDIVRLNQDNNRNQLSMTINGVTKVITERQAVPKGPVLIEIWRDSEDNLKVIVNGVDISIPDLKFTGTLSLNGFGFDGNGSSGWDDYAFEYIIADQVPTTAQQVATRDYLRTKWNLFEGTEVPIEYPIEEESQPDQAIEEVIAPDVETESVTPEIARAQLPIAILPASNDVHNGMIARITFDGTSDDDLGHQTEASDITYSTGRYGQAATFNGISSSVQLSAINIAPPYTVSFWTQPRETPKYRKVQQVMLDGGRSGGCQFIPSVAYRVPSAYVWNGATDASHILVRTGGCRDKRFTSTSVYELNQWHHVVVVGHSDSHRSVYLNGELVEDNQNVLVRGLKGSRRCLFIGSSQQSPCANPSSFFNGLIDEVRVYNRAFSDTEAKTLTQLRDVLPTTLPTTEIETSVEQQNQAESNTTNDEESEITNETDPTSTSNSELEDTAPNSTVVDAIPTDQLVHLTFDNTFEDATSNRVVELEGNLTYANGRFGQAARFDGATNLTVRIQSLTPSYSVSFWMRPEATPIGARDTFGITDGGRSGGCKFVPAINYSGLGELLFSTSGCDGLRSIVPGISENSWYHVAVVVEPTSHAVYVDGREVATLSGLVNKGISGRRACVFVGARQRSDCANPDDFFTGLMDDYRIYDRALTPSEIAGLAGLTVSIDTLNSSAPLVSSLVNPPKLPLVSLSSSLPTPCTFNFTRNLSRGDEGQDVLELQQFLNKTLPTPIVAIGPGSPGSETIFYGDVTVEGVKAFQEMYATETLLPFGHSFGTGYFYDLTRNKANQLCGN